MNVILIALDTLRADHLGCYGYRHATSPVLDAFAGESVLFENYFAPSIPTHPSFTSLFTSMDAFGHQVVNVRGVHELAPEIKLLPEMLQGHGVFTAAADNLRRWFTRGYDLYESPRPGFNRQAQQSDRPWETEKRWVEAANAVAVPMLERLKERQPFLFFYHTWDPHTPYWPPAEYRRMFYDGDERDAANRSMRPVWAFDGMRYLYEKWFDPAVTDARYIVAQYDGEIRYMDDHLAGLFDAFKAAGVYDNSLIVVFSDHGEILDDHTGQFDHQGLYEGDIHVPLIVRLPGGEHAGTRVGGLCANVDVLPTIFELLELPPPEQAEGRSLMPLVRGEREANYDQLFIGESNWQVKRGVRTRQWKLIRPLSLSPWHNWHGEGRVELYHLPADPDEQTNVAHMHPRVVAELERRLDAWVAARGEQYGHEDPFKVQGTVIGREALKRVRAADRARSEPIL